ncbi:MAG: hypothetical protein QM642_02490 [Edaphocola sp.]
MKTNIHRCALLASLLLGGCGMEQSGNGGPLILGDSATIVTEKDSQYLKDDVMDIAPVAAGSVNASQMGKIDTQSSAPTKVLPPADEPEHAPNINAAGTALDFGGVKVVLSPLSTKEFKKQDPEKTNSLTYGITGGNVANSKIIVAGAGNVTVRLRYQSHVQIKGKLGTLDLSNLGKYTSGWQNLSAIAQSGTQVFAIAGLAKPDFVQIGNAQIKNAADRELRRHRNSSRTINSWMQEIRSIRKPGDEPSEVLLDNVQLQLRGTDAKGKSFSKLIRLEL